MGSSATFSLLFFFLASIASASFSRFVIFRFRSGAGVSFSACVAQHSAHALLAFRSCRGGNARRGNDLAQSLHARTRAASASFALSSSAFASARDAASLARFAARLRAARASLPSTTSRGANEDDARAGAGAGAAPSSRSSSLSSSESGFFTALARVIDAATRRALPPPARDDALDGFHCRSRASVSAWW